MAGFGTKELPASSAAAPSSSSPSPLPLDSHDTALCIMPPPHLRDPVDRLRHLYDKAYDKWPPHVNLVYPFVRPENLEQAVERLACHLRDGLGGASPPWPVVRLDTPGYFTHHQDTPSAAAAAATSSTIHLRERDESQQGGDAQRLKTFRATLLEGLGHGGGGGGGERSSASDYQPHLTIGQSHWCPSSSSSSSSCLPDGTAVDIASTAPHNFLLEKARLLPPLEWKMAELCILVRDRGSGGGSDVNTNGEGTPTSPSSRSMKLWGTMDLTSPLFGVSRCWLPESSVVLNPQQQQLCSRKSPFVYSSPSATAPGKWVQYDPSLPTEKGKDTSTERAISPDALVVASYNVLAEFHWPPSSARYPLLIDNILARDALADVLVLHEVTDGFLSYFLNDARVRQQYRFVSRGPPDQDDIEPLPSHLNPVILSRRPFTWEWLPLGGSSGKGGGSSSKRSHKGSAVVQFSDVGVRRQRKAHEDDKYHDEKEEDEEGNEAKVFIPAVLATVHLTCGLSDGAAAAKKHELQALLSHLTRRYPHDSPCVLLGDFNVTTSAHTLEAAVKARAVSPQTPGLLQGLTSTVLADAGFVDTWTAARVRYGCGGGRDHVQEWGEGSLYEGEEGATFDPTVNGLAAQIVGGGYNSRPQRYDRIMTRSGGLFEVAGFNLFGRSKATLGKPDREERDDETEEVTSKAIPQAISKEATDPSYASDHWGVRCLLKFSVEASKSSQSNDVQKQIVPVRLEKATGSLAQVCELRDCLELQGAFPSKQEVAEREIAFNLIKDVILDNSNKNNKNNNDDHRSANGAAAPPTHRGQPTFVVVPVGSYGMGTWTSSSDIDAFCIGPISSRTFFALATQRIRRAAHRGIRIIRRVNAHSGTMLELDVRGFKADLQYCPSAVIAESWPAAMRLTPQDPVFALPTQTLAKLKPARDLHYLLRTVPDLAAFRLAYRLIRRWAQIRGIYSARLGYLGGIHIAVLLTRVCKLLAVRHGSESGSGSGGSGAPVSSVADLLVSFFAHYAEFDWANDMAFDPFFFFSGNGRSSSSSLRYVRTTREPLAILGWHPPALNTAHAASLPSVRTLSREFERAHRILSSSSRGGGSDMTWTEFLGGAGAEGFAADAAAREFLAQYKSYVKIDVQFWSTSLAKGSGFVGWLESRCVLLLVDLSRRLPNIHARMWPTRFVDADADAVGEDEDRQARDYQGYYLIGLEKRDRDRDGGSGEGSRPGAAAAAAAAQAKEDMKVAYGSLQTVLRKFESQIRGDERYFDAKSCWMSASVVRQADVAEGLRADNRAWGEYTIGDDESEEEEEEEEEDDDEIEDDDQDGGSWSGDDGALGGDGGAAEPAAAGRKANKKRSALAAAAAAERPPHPPRPPYAGRFRSSADVMNRLRWDPELDSGDFVVGYEDRFLGTKERALDLWKSEQTDDEFIPQHRILYFRRKGDGDGDGAVVWDRRRRLDDVFGSGVSSLGKGR